MTQRRRRLAVAVCVLAAASSCSGPEAPAAPTVIRLFAQDTPVTIGRETRLGWVAPEGGGQARRLTFTPPTQARLELGYGIPSKGLAPGARPVRFLVTLEHEGRRHEVFETTLDPGDRRPQAWRDLRVDLADWAGREIALDLAVVPTEGAGSEARGAWSTPVVVGGAPDPRPNVLILSLDTLRSRNVGTYGYGRDTTPFLDAFATRGAVFEETVTTSVTTGPSHMSLFTGLYPVNHGLRTGLDWKLPDTRTVAETLRDAGYHTAAFTENGYIDRLRGFGAGFEEYTENRGDRKRGPGEVRVTFGQAERWLERGPRRPFFLFVHTYQVHAPFVPPEAYTGLFVDDGFPGPEDPTMRRHRDDYDREIRFVDDRVKALLAALDAAGLADDTLVAILSDHGEEFGEHGLYQHGGAVYEETIRIPWLLVGPGVPAGRRVATPASLIDVMPTLFDLIGRPVPEGLDGVSLRPALEGASMAPRTLFTEARARRRWVRPKLGEVWNPPLVAVRAPEGKFIVHRPDEGEALPAARYDLETDALETRPQPVEGEEGRALDALVDAYLKGRVDPATLRAPDDPEDIDPELRQRLKLLGYLE